MEQNNFLGVFMSSLHWRHTSRGFHWNGGGPGRQREVSAAWAQGNGHETGTKSYYIMASSAGSITSLLCDLQ